MQFGAVFRLSEQKQEMETKTISENNWKHLAAAKRFFIS